jgi:hypothetical protein
MSMRTPLPALTLALACAGLLAPTRGEAQDVYSFGAIATVEPPRVISADSALLAMKERLRTLIAAQEGYWLTHGTFTTDVSAMGLHVTGTERRNQPTVAVVFAGGRGWSAVATHAGLPARSCVVFAGEEDGLPRLPATLKGRKKPQQPGVPVCDKP